VAEFDLSAIHAVRAYVKRPEDLDSVRTVLEKEIRSERIVYLWDEICRPGLLVEVEGIAGD